MKHFFPLLRKEELRGAAFEIFCWCRALRMPWVSKIASDKAMKRVEEIYTSVAEGGSVECHLLHNSLWCTTT